MCEPFPVVSLLSKFLVKKGITGMRIWVVPGKKYAKGSV